MLAEGLVRSRLPVACLDLSTLQLGGGIPLRAGAVRKLSRVPGLRKLVVQNRGVALERMMHAEEEHMVYISTHMFLSLPLASFSFFPGEVGGSSPSFHGSCGTWL